METVTSLPGKRSLADSLDPIEVEFDKVIRHLSTKNLAVDLYSEENIPYASSFNLVIALDMFPVSSVVPMTVLQHKVPNVIPIRLAIDTLAKTLVDKRVDMVNVNAGPGQISQVLFAIEQWKFVTKMIVIPTMHKANVPEFGKQLFSGHYITGYSCNGRAC